MKERIIKLILDRKLGRDRYTIDYDFENCMIIWVIYHNPKDFYFLESLVDNIRYTMPAIVYISTRKIRF
jgi:hypothetical protein